jgi:hypothetical protein
MNMILKVELFLDTSFFMDWNQPLKFNEEQSQDTIKLNGYWNPNFFL